MHLDFVQIKLYTSFTLQHTVLHNTTPHHTRLHHTTQHHTTSHHTTPNHTTQYHTTPHHTKSLILHSFTRHFNVFPNHITPHLPLHTTVSTSTTPHTHKTRTDQIVQQPHPCFEELQLNHNALSN